MSIIKHLSIFTVLIVAVLHGVFLVLEMFLWQHPLGLDVFSMSAEEAKTSAVLAKNQGLYNGFLMVGLLWALINNHYDVKVLFLIFVIIAGIYGALTVGTTVFFVQALPAIIALVITIWHKLSSTST